MGYQTAIVPFLKEQNRLSDQYKMLEARQRLRNAFVCNFQSYLTLPDCLSKKLYTSQPQSLLVKLLVCL